MDKKQAQEIAEQVVEYLFLDNDKPRKPVARLMLVYGGEEYKNPGWSRDAIKGAIVEHIIKSAQHRLHQTAGGRGSKKSKLVVPAAGKA
jgi:hypothetical protein